MTAAILIQSYYLMLIGWILGYFRMIVTGQLATVPPDRLVATYETFIGTPGPVIAYTMLVIVVLAFIASRGLRRGLERVSMYAMPVLFVLLLLLAIRSVTYPGAWQGLVWYLMPDFSAINGRIVLEALGHAFYSIGIGMATAFGLGSYLHRQKSDVPGSVALVVACDTFVAFLAGLVIFPALFAFGLEPDTGPGLLFVTMTNMFARMPAGNLFGGAFLLPVDPGRDNLRGSAVRGTDDDAHRLDQAAPCHRHLVAGQRLWPAIHSGNLVVGAGLGPARVRDGPIRVRRRDIWALPASPRRFDASPVCRLCLGIRSFP